MKHLQDAEFVDLIEGTLSPERVAHATACEACRAQVDAMHSSLASARVVPPAEPPALFWDHFAARVNSAIDAPAPSERWWSVPRFTVAAVAIVLVALAALTYVRPMRNATTQPAAEQTSTADPAFIGFDDLESDEGWAVVRAAAEDLDADAAAAAGLTAGPGTVEQVAAQLTEAERAELIRLVEDEIKRSGA